MFIEVSKILLIQSNEHIPMTNVLHHAIFLATCNANLT